MSNAAELARAVAQLTAENKALKKEQKRLLKVEKKYKELTERLAHFSIWAGNEIDKAELTIATKPGKTEYGRAEATSENLRHALAHLGLYYTPSPRNLANVSGRIKARFRQFARFKE